MTAMSGKRTLPLSLGSEGKGDRSKEKKPIDDSNHEEYHGGRAKVAPGMGTSQFSNLMEGVVFALSGFVNPERSILRSQALDMGADYKPDWTSDCTLLVCAFPNTPKFRQVEADNGTIVSKDWISECYNQKKVVEIDSYLMHAGKPWRRSMIVKHAIQDPVSCHPEKPHHGAQKKSKHKSIAIDPEVPASNTVETNHSLSKVKEWAGDDLNKTVLWLENQEDKPDPAELKSIASEGILTCLQDCIAALDENQDIKTVTEQWKFVPRVVEELKELAHTKKSSESLPRKELSKQAVVWKKIYQQVFDDVLTTNAKSKKLRTKKAVEQGKEKDIIMSDDTGSDSDKTIEMTEDEIELACHRFDIVK